MGDEAGVRSEQSINGGTDVWSSFDASASTADHLVVMVHGILGSTADWQYGANQFVKMLPDKVIVHCSERNMYGLTLDGIDVMGERLAKEVVEVINRRPGVRKISFVAHSVGGLVARYAIGRLYRPPRTELVKDQADGIHDENSVGTICGLEAMNFITVASPHLGSRGNNQILGCKSAIQENYLSRGPGGAPPSGPSSSLHCTAMHSTSILHYMKVPFLFGVTAVEKIASRVVHWIFKRTGRHLFLTDNDDGQPPLLQRMVNDCGDLYFMSALRAFKRRVAYANVGYDHIVGWRTSSIRRKSELPKWEDCLRETYPHIVYEEFSKGDDTDNSAQVSVSEDDSDIIEEELVTGLSHVSWEKVDVSFHNSMHRFAAHNVIQVKYFFMQSEGADVIQHMIDHFLV